MGESPLGPGVAGKADLTEPAGAGAEIQRSSDAETWGGGADYFQRFGIVWVDYPTQERKLKDSALWYREVARSGRIGG